MFYGLSCRIEQRFIVLSVFPACSNDVVLSWYGMEYRQLRQHF